MDWRKILTAVALAGFGASAAGYRPDDPPAENVVIHVRNPAGRAVAGVRVAVWTPLMSSVTNTPVAVTDASGDASVTVPGFLVRPKAYAIVPGDQQAVMNGWVEQMRTAFLQDATKIDLDGSGTENEITITSKPVVTLACRGGEEGAPVRRHLSISIVGLLLSGDPMQSDGTLFAHGVPKAIASSMIASEGVASKWIEIPASMAQQDGAGPTFPEISVPTGEVLRLEVERLALCGLPPSWDLPRRINLVAADGSVCYTYAANSAGKVQGQWNRTTRHFDDIRLPVGQYFVICGPDISYSMPAQRLWAALRAGRATELATAGLISVTVAAPPTGQEPPLITVDAKDSLDQVVEQLGLAD